MSELKFNKLKNVEELEEYMRNQVANSGYCHYTSLYTINQILLKNTIWITPFSRLNDMVERDLFGKDKDLYFSLCFCKESTENLPLWYLYSGIDGRGGSIRFTKCNVKKLVEKGRFVLTTFKKQDELLMELTQSEMECFFEDVIYYSENEESGFVELKYGAQVNKENITIAEFNKYKDKHKGFYKSLIWNYEREKRLVVKLKGEARKYVKANKLNDDDYYIVKLDFSETLKTYSDLQIRLAPEIEKEEIEEIMENNRAIKQFIIGSSNVKISDYSGTIKMNIKDKLCGNCVNKKYNAEK